MITIPARVPFPHRKIVLGQKEPPFGPEAKIRIRSAAKRIAAYRLPVTTVPVVTGHTDSGETISIDTLGRWVFGVPGFQGHVRVSPYPEKIIVEVCSEDVEVIDLLVEAARKIGLPLRYVAAIPEGTILRLGGITMEKVENIWENIRSAMRECGDIGNFNPDDIEVVENQPYGWKGERWPVGLDELEKISSHGLNTPAAQSVYATLARVAAMRLGITGTDATAWGEFFGSQVAGWSGRFGNLDSIIKRLESIFCDDGYVRLGYIYAEQGSNFFQDAEVQAHFQKAFAILKEMR